MSSASRWGRPLHRNLCFPGRIGWTGSSSLLVPAGAARRSGWEPAVWETLSDKSGTAADLANRMFSVLFTKDWLAEHDPWNYCPEVLETTSEAGAARQAEAFYTWPGSYDRLPQIRSSTLVLTGTDDVVIPPANAVTLSERIPGARLAQFPGAGHGLMYQCPTEFVKVVREFLDIVA